MLFSIDHENSAVKTPNFVFTSGLADYPVRPPVETDVLEFGGKFWTLSGQRIAYMRDKTKDKRPSTVHKLDEAGWSERIPRVSRRWTLRQYDTALLWSVPQGSGESRYRKIDRAKPSGRM